MIDFDLLRDGDVSASVDRFWREALCRALREMSADDREATLRFHRDHGLWIPPEFAGGDE